MKTLLHSFGFFILSCFLVQPELISQCTPTDFQEVYIYPDSTIVASLIVEDAFISDLADPAQGVCGVNINFTHNSIKELEVRLISPSGQSIDLIGPISPDGSITFNPQWDVSFLPCTETVTADPGFSNPWTNTDNWAGPQTYTGSYHPYQNCLEDVFDTGPVNGLWSLEILNDARFDDGDLLSFSLEFCDDNFDCDQCIATPGTFESLSLPSDFCQGTTGLDFDFENIKVNNPQDYGYQFYILQGDEVIDIVDDPDLTQYSPGAYQICGLSYYLNQEANLLSDNSFSVLKDTYNSALSPVCAAFTETCFSFNILPFADTLMIDTTICLGSNFSFNGMSYEDAGMYTDQLGDGLCDTLVMIDLKTVELEALISNDSDLLTCDNESIELGVGSSTMTSNTETFWRTDDGSFEGDSNGSSVFARQAGRYWLVLSEGGCMDSFSVDISLDTDVPTVAISVSDTLDCLVNLVDLIVTSNPAATSYEWSGPESGLPDDQNIKVGTPGEYSVKVTLPSGCSSIASHVVESDFTEPELEVATTDIDCNQNFGTAQILNIAQGITYEYADGNFNNPDIIEYNNTGEYTITATFNKNGCSSDTTFTIRSLVAEPALTFTPVENITCGNQSVALEVNSDIDIESYSWTGPEGPISSDQNIIQVTAGGEYMVTAIATNGCNNEASQTIIAENTEQPSITLSASLITCNNSSAEINVNSDQGGISYTWTGVNGFTSNLQNPIVTEAGKYYVSAEVSASCEVIDSIVVMADIAPPQLDPSSLPITCTNPSRILTIENQQADIVYTWRDATGNILSGLSPSVTEPGDYILEGTGPNGCTDDAQLSVEIDTIAPIAQASAPEVLLCDRTQVNLSANGSSSGPNYSYAWSTSDGSMVAAANTSSPLVSAAGTYELVVTDLTNGCASRTSVLLEETTSDISDFEFEKFDPPCSDVPLGRIEVNNVIGGVGPYTYSSDGFNFQEESILDMLSAQVYTVAVKDAYGCSVSKNVIVEEGLEVSVDLEDTYEINLGDEIEIESILNTNGDPLRSIEWSLSNQPIATGEERVTLRPLQSTTIEVAIQTLSGCMSSTSAIINVTKEKDIYTPNTISVSDFGENGSFKVYPSNAVDEVISVNIFDRWGNKVFAAERYDPHTETRAWDGKHKSQNLLPGIYVYIIEVLLIDGEQRVIPGEVLVVR